jgi:5-oxopent-3-ene-1,2,5-tricarboxylate decarboxylase/2-hydroxyhepta-2,4-diene-1,7-dioate isomerase
MIAKSHPALAHVRCPLPPWGLSGVVVGPLLNARAALAALGNAVHAAPYKDPPKAPVLYFKPPHTLLAPGEPVPAGAEGLEVGASLALVIGRSACRLDAARALEAVAGVGVVVDFSVPHASFYRPSVRLRARDASCLVGPAVVPLAQAGDVDALALRVWVDGVLAQDSTTGGMRRPAAALLADVTEFMTLSPGDLLLLGVPHGAPVAHAGQSVAVAIDGLERVEATLAAAPAPAGGVR